MKLNFNSLIKAHNALSALTEQDKAKSYVFALSVRFKLAGNISRLKELIEKIQVEQGKLFEQFGTANDKGQHEVKRTSDKWTEFEAAMKAIAEEEFDVEVKTLTESELGNSRTVKSRDEKGQVSENAVENQVSLDVIADLLSTRILVITG